MEIHTASTSSSLKSLLFGVESKSCSFSLVISATLNCKPRAVTVATIVIVNSVGVETVPAAIEPMFQTMEAPCVLDPALTVTVFTVIPAGKKSVSSTPVAIAPEFCTFTV